MFCYLCNVILVILVDFPRLANLFATRIRIRNREVEMRRIRKRKTAFLSVIFPVFFSKYFGSTTLLHLTKPSRIINNNKVYLVSRSSSAAASERTAALSKYLSFILFRIRFFLLLKFMYTYKYLI